MPLIAYPHRGVLQCAIEAHLSRCKGLANLLPLNENTQSASIKALVKQGFGMGWLRLREPRSDDLLTLWKTLEAQHA